MGTPAGSPAGLLAEPPVLWKRSARARRVSLRIDPREGHVIITLPARASRRIGLELLEANAEWVRERLAALPGRTLFRDGAEVPLDGAARRIRHRPGARGGAWLDGDQIVVAGEAEFLARRVTDFYRQTARSRFTALVAAKAAGEGLRPGPVRVRDARTRWGSCAPDRTLSFSWRLVMAPPFVQDYVAGHEVAHLRHMNHGPQFWVLANRLTPHREAAVAWLHSEGARLLRIG